jgi:hypothetical protein
MVTCAASLVGYSLRRCLRDRTVGGGVESARPCQFQPSRYISGLTDEREIHAAASCNLTRARQCIIVTSGCTHSSYQINVPLTYQD